MTCTSRPFCTPMSAASRPIGPAPVTTAALRVPLARLPVRSACSHAFATTLVGSSRTPSGSELCVELHERIGLRPVPLPHEPVERLDAVLGVLAVPAEVPLAGGAAVARYGIRPPHDADDIVALRQAGPIGCLGHATDRLVPEHQPLVARRRPSVLAGGDLEIGAADSDRDASRRGRARRPQAARRSSSSCADPALPGTTVMAFTWPPP